MQNAPDNPNPPLASDDPPADNGQNTSQPDRSNTDQETGQDPLPGDRPQSEPRQQTGYDVVEEALRKQSENEARR